MKNILICLTFMGVLNAQTDSLNKNFSTSNKYHKNSSHISHGYGFPNFNRSQIQSVMESSHHLTRKKLNTTEKEYSYSRSGSGPLFLKYEYAPHDQLGVGIVVAYFTARVEEIANYEEYEIESKTLKVTTLDHHTDTRSIDMKSVSVGGRFNYHFGRVAKTDLYCGLSAGFVKSDVSDSFSSTDTEAIRPVEINMGDSFLYLSTTFGVREYLSKYLGLYVEVGYDKGALVQGGLLLKFD